MRQAALVAAMLLLAACGSQDQDKLPDDLQSAEGTATPEPDVAPEPEPEPETLPEPAANVAMPPPADPLAPAPPTAVPTSAQPSFDCTGRLKRVEGLICTSPDLARLDRQVAAAYERALDEADIDQDARLRRLGTRYLTDRDRCETTYCVAQAYRWYRRDIHLVMGWPTP